MASILGGNKGPIGSPAKLTHGIKPNTDLSKNGAVLTREPNQGPKLPAAAWSNTWPAPGATLDLDFANDRGFVRGVGQGKSMDAVTFTRASSANWVDSAGTLRTGAGSFPGTANALGNNLLTFPQDFDNAAWTKNSVTVTANSTIAPDGTNTADTITHGSATGEISQINSIGAVICTFSFYAQYSNVQWIRPVLGSAANNIVVWFDIQNGIKGNTANNGTSTHISSSITSVGSGWYRCEMTAALTGTSNNYVQLNTAASNGSNTRAIGSFVVWGAQLEVGSPATTYYPTNINVPRFDWASTAALTQTAGPYQVTTSAPVIPNLLTYSEQFDNAAWDKGGINVSANTNETTDPLGGNTADKFIETAENRTHRAASLNTAWQAITYTASCYIKKGTRQWAVIFVIINGSGGINTTRVDQWFDLDNIQIGTTSEIQVNGTTDMVDFVSASISDAGNGWRRCVLTFTPKNSPVTYSSNGVLFGLSSADGTLLYLGTTSNYGYFWGAQLELANTNTPLAAKPTCNGLLIEESRANRLLWCRDASQTPNRNLLTYSEQLDNAAWTKFRCAVTANDQVAPDGTTTGDKINCNATSANGFFVWRFNNMITVPVNTNLVLSIYGKKGSRNQFILNYFSDSAGNNGVRACFDLDAGTYVSSETFGSGVSIVGTPTIASAANGWYRMSMTITSNTATANPGVYPSITSSTDFNCTSGVDYGYIWGAQLERGSTASTYEATTTTGSIWSKLDITAAKDQTGIDGVASSASSLTASADAGTCIQTITLASGSRTGSVYLKRITGTGNVQVTLDGSTWSTVDLSNGLWNRIVLSGTVTNPTVGIRLATNGDAVAMDYGQIEDGSDATTPILTTTASVTRATEQSPSVRMLPGVYDFLTRDRVRGLFSDNQTVTSTRNITVNSGVRYITRLVAFTFNYLKGQAKTIMGVAE